jgi:hypothetical protein
MKMQMTKESIFLLNLHGKLQHQMQTEPFNEPWKRHQKIDLKKKGHFMKELIDLFFLVPDWIYSMKIKIGR